MYTARIHRARTCACRAWTSFIIKFKLASPYLDANCYTFIHQLAILDAGVGAGARNCLLLLITKHTRDVFLGSALFAHFQDLISASSSVSNDENSYALTKARAFCSTRSLRINNIFRDSRKKVGFILKLAHRWVVINLLRFFAVILIKDGSKGSVIFFWFRVFLFVLHILLWKKLLFSFCSGILRVFIYSFIFYCVDVVIA